MCLYIGLGYTCGQVSAFILQWRFNTKVKLRGCTILRIMIHVAPASVVALRKATDFSPLTSVATTLIQPQSAISQLVSASAAAAVAEALYQSYEQRCRIMSTNTTTTQ